MLECITLLEILFEILVPFVMVVIVVFGCLCLGMTEAA